MYSLIKMLIFIAIVIALGVVAMKGARKRSERRNEAISNLIDYIRKSGDNN